jgi:uncharacterized protein YbbC (DUF1343 family)
MTWSRENCICMIALFVLSLTTAGAANAAPPPNISWESAAMDPALEGKIDQAVARSMDEGNMAGCVVLVGRGAGIVFEKAYGHRSIEPEAEKMTIDTVFDIASLTKPLATATAIMILAERGKLKLDDTVATHIPGFARHGKQDVTIEQLLVHSSGLIADNPLADYENGWESAAAKINELELLSTPGMAFKYSDVNFILLGKIIEAVAGKPQNEFVEEAIFAKLGMNETGYLPSEKLKARAAATEKNGDSWIKGEVHDPRAAKMGGVAGHAGLFSTARDMAIYATMVLHDGRYGDVQFLKAETVYDMTAARKVGDNTRGLGWDKRSVYSRNRGRYMTDRAFGHGGFTGTAMWIDPGLDLYVIFLSNRLHPDGAGEVNSLAGQIGGFACAAIVPPCANCGAESRPAEDHIHPVRLGIDVLVRDEFKLLDGKRVGLITNQTGRDSSGATTIDLMHQARNFRLVALFSPEHGIRGVLDQSKIDDTVDEATGLPIYSLYGERRAPSREQLAELDVLVFDVQDIGARFYTNISTMGLAMRAAAEAQKSFVVLDRPNPIGGEIIEGPLLDQGAESFVGHHRLPIRYAMTIGELAKMFQTEQESRVELTVVPMEGWRRSMYLFDTNLLWTYTSPNMRSLRAAVLYPGIGMLEFTNLSVGRGTDTPFEVMGAPWIRERELAAAVNAANLLGVRVVPLRFTPNASKFAGEECGGLSFIITDWNSFRSFDLGLTIATALRELHRDQWQPERWMVLLGNQEVYDRVMKGDEPADILKMIDEQTKQFRERRKRFHLYE